MLEITPAGMEFMEKLEKAQKPKEVMEEKFEGMSVSEFETFIENLLLSGEDFIKLFNMIAATEEEKAEYFPRGLYHFVLKNMGKQGSEVIKQKIIEKVKEAVEKGENIFGISGSLLKAATTYAKKTESRLEEIEEEILKFEGTAMEYGLEVIKGRWPGLEHLIKDFFRNKFEYRYKGMSTSEVSRYVRRKGVAGNEAAIREIFGIEEPVDIESLRFLVTCVDCILPSVLGKFQNETIQKKLQELKEALDRYDWVEEKDEDRAMFLALFNTLFNYVEKTRHGSVFYPLVIQIFFFFDKHIIDAVIEKIVNRPAPASYEAERQSTVRTIESAFFDMLFYFRRAWSADGKKANEESTLAHARMQLVQRKLKQEGRSIFLLHNLLIDHNDTQEKNLIKKLLEENQSLRENVKEELEEAEKKLRDGLGCYDTSCAEVDGEDFGFGFKERILQAAIEGASKNLAKYIEAKEELQKFEDGIANSTASTSQISEEKYTLTLIKARKFKAFQEVAESLIKQVFSDRPFSYILERNKNIEYFMLVIGMENGDWEAYKELIQSLKTNRPLILKRRLRAKRKVAEAAQDQSQ